MSDGSHGNRQGRRTHRSRVPLGSLHAVAPETMRADMKPQGLWYGVDGDWERWCRSEMPEWISGAPYVYDIEWGSADVLLLDTPEKLLAFHRTYRRDLVPSVAVIDWPAVVRRWDGIEIAPYCWELRMNHNLLWYYGWDCASGCVWNAVKLTVRLISSPLLPALPAGETTEAKP